MTTYITRAELEAINDAIPDVHGLNHLAVLCNAAIQYYRDSLVAGVVLPESVAYGTWDSMLGRGNRLMSVRLDKGQDGCTEPLYTADQLRQAVADSLAKQVPQGYKLVPVETTKEMQMAASSVYLDTHGYADSWIKAVYTAMLAAAPDPKEGV